MEVPVFPYRRQWRLIAAGGALSPPVARYRRRWRAIAAGGRLPLLVGIAAGGIPPWPLLGPLGPPFVPPGPVQCPSVPLDAPWCPLVPLAPLSPPAPFLVILSRPCLPLVAIVLPWVALDNSWLVPWSCLGSLAPTGPSQSTLVTRAAVPLCASWSPLVSVGPTLVRLGSP